MIPISNIGHAFIPIKLKEAGQKIDFDPLACYFQKNGNWKMIKHIWFYDERWDSREKNVHADELKKLDKAMKDKGLDKYERLLDLYTD